MHSAHQLRSTDRRSRGRIPSLLLGLTAWALTPALAPAQSERESALRVELERSVARSLELKQQVESLEVQLDQRSAQWAELQAVLADRDDTLQHLLARVTDLEAQVSQLEAERAQALDHTRAALDFLERAMAADPNQESNHDVSVRAVLEQAAAKLSKSGIEPSVQSHLLESMAKAYSELGDEEASADLLKRARALSPDSASVLKELAKKEFELGRRQKAQDLLEQSLRLDPDSSDVRKLLADLLAQEGRWEEASAHLGKVLAEERAKDPSALRKLAEARLELGQPQAAVELLEQYQDVLRQSKGAKGPEYHDALRALAAAYQQLGDVERARAILRKLSIVEVQDPEPKDRSWRTLAEMAELERRRGDLEHALELAKQAASQVNREKGVEHPDSLEATLIVLRLLQETGREDEAQAVIEKWKDQLAAREAVRKDEEARAIAAKRLEAVKALEAAKKSQGSVKKSEL